MNQLIFFIVSVGLLLVFYVLIQLRTLPKCNTSCDAKETLRKLVPLPSLDFEHYETLFDDADYSLLSASPRLKSIARQLLKDRRRLALAWLRMLRSDVYTLWRFRRLLTVFGVPSGIKEELATACRAMVLLCFLFGLSLLVAVFGPVAFASLAARVRNHVHGYSCLCGDTLARLPMHRLAMLENYWRNLKGPNSAVRSF